MIKYMSIDTLSTNPTILRDLAGIVAGKTTVLSYLVPSITEVVTMPLSVLPCSGNVYFITLLAGATTGVITADIQVNGETIVGLNSVVLSTTPQNLFAISGNSFQFQDILTVKIVTVSEGASVTNLSLCVVLDNISYPAP